MISKIAGIKNISQYPLFRKKDNIVTTAKIFTEVNTYLSFDKNKKKYLDNQKIYIDLTTEYIEESKT